MYCTKCGNELSEDSTFCTKCGNKINNMKIDSKIKEYKFFSSREGTSKIIINNNKITIIRPGILSKFSHGFTGEKTILIKDISAVQYKPAGISQGYLQFIFPGSREQRSGIVSGKTDENIIYFDASFDNKKINTKAKEIKEYIENYNNKNSNNITNVYNSSDKYDKLDKIKKLLDNGVLTKEEFEEEKKKILK